MDEVEPYNYNEPGSTFTPSRCPFFTSIAGLLLHGRMGLLRREVPDVREPADNRGRYTGNLELRVWRKRD